MNTKEKILYISLDLFAQKGYLATSISDIAYELKISKGALYKHYKNKEDIFDSILKRMEENDTANAKSYELPIDTFKGHVSLKTLCDYTINQVIYWTQNEFANSFRKLLTIEQYRSDKMNKLYQQYLVTGPIKYIEKILANNGIENSLYLSYSFYVPILGYFPLFDANPTDRGPFYTLQDHLDNFIKMFENHSW